MSCSFPYGAFARDMVVVSQDVSTYHGLEEGMKSSLVLAWSPTNENNNRFMTTVRALTSIVGSRNVPSYRIATNPTRNFGFILCPNSDMAEILRARYITVGQERVFFDLIRSVQLMPFDDDVNQHASVHWWI